MNQSERDWSGRGVLKESEKPSGHRNMALMTFARDKEVLTKERRINVMNERLFLSST